VLGGAAAAGAAGYAAGGNDRGMEYAGYSAAAALAAGQFIGLGFGRKDENEADKLGFAFYTRAGWDPEKFADFFAQMIEKGHDTTPEMMSSHPSLKGRVEAAKRRASELPKSAEKWRRPPVAEAARFRALQERAARLGKEMPEDKSLEQAQSLLSAFPSCVSPTDQPGQKEAREEVMRAARGAE
ncbi:MAG: M48 family metalloprotease, partial [Tepidisphaeraceae bacterium]